MKCLYAILSLFLLVGCNSETTKTKIRSKFKLQCAQSVNYVLKDCNNHEEIKIVKVLPNFNLLDGIIPRNVKLPISKKELIPEGFDTMEIEVKMQFVFTDYEPNKTVEETITLPVSQLLKEDFPPVIINNFSLPSKALLEIVPPKNDTLNLDISVAIRDYSVTLPNQKIVYVNAGDTIVYEKPYSGAKRLSKQRECFMQAEGAPLNFNELYFANSEVLFQETIKSDEIEMEFSYPYLTVMSGISGGELKFVGGQKFKYSFPRSFNYQLIMERQHLRYGIKNEEFMDLIKRFRLNNKTKLNPLIRVYTSKEETDPNAISYAMEETMYALKYRSIVEDCSNEIVIDSLRQFVSDRGYFVLEEKCI
jgi:hypothetical protein